jgi:hypothetical protein
MAYEIASKPQWLTMPDPDFLALLYASAKSKQHSHETHHNIHLPELNARLRLNLTLPPVPPADDADPFAYRADLSNTRKIKVLYLGNSMMERFKTTGSITHLGRLGKDGVAWNAGCGGDKSENVLYRLHEGLYQHLKAAQEDGRCDIKLIILASGTNDVRLQKGLRDEDVEAYRLLLMVRVSSIRCVEIRRLSKTSSTCSVLRHRWLSFADLDL